ncbi:MAG: methyltransferase domain-containing protein [Actinomycetota bacterium]|nr:methyltransferase domain-containing protein [Actinomycetota bacterium]
MRDTFAAVLRCPRCRADGSYALVPRQMDTREIREGGLQCRHCGHTAAITNGIVDGLYEPPSFVTREADGLERFADLMRRDGWDRQRVLALPEAGADGYWFVQRASMQQIQQEIDLHPGRRILDVGSNTCWASNIFAELGLDVVALDISAHEMQGLRTADWWFADRGVFFERVLGVMFDIPLARETFDYVFCSEVLHHNNLVNLVRTFREFRRILRPGGQVLVINEQLRCLFDLKLHPGQDVAEYEGYEHVFFLQSYLLAARLAGFDVHLLDPIYHPYFRDEPYVLGPSVSLSAGMRMAILNGLRHSHRGRRLYRMYLTLIKGGVGVNFIATKR